MKKNKLPTSFGICGSCVNVDIFSYYKDPEQALKDHVAMRDNTFFQTPVRPAVPIKNLLHSSSLHTMWIRTAYDGKVFEFLEQNAGEYLLIDLVDERFDLFEYGGQNFVSHFFEESNFFDQIDKNQCRFFSQRDLTDQEAEIYIRKFCEKLTEIYPPEKIIINRFLLADQYLDKSGKQKPFTRKTELYHVAKSTDLFPKWYDYFVKYLPGCKELVLDKSYTAYEMHPRGLSPTHRTMDYYEDAYKAIQKMVADDYARQRQIPLTSIAPQMRINEDESNALIKLGCSEYISKTLLRLKSQISLEGKRFLWISNKNVPAAATRRLKIEKFCQLFIPSGDESDELFIEKHTDAQWLNDQPAAPAEIFLKRNFAYYIGSVSEINPDFLDQFDIIFFDDIEYTADFGLCMDNLYKVLKKGGTLIAKTGRTWSAPDGNKWNADASDYGLKGKTKIMDYVHLLSNPMEVRSAICRQTGCSPAAAEDMAAAAYRGDKELNHLFYEDYADAVQNSLFHKKCIAPIYPVNVSEDVIAHLKERYPGYEKFDYKSLYIVCNK